MYVTLCLVSFFCSRLHTQILLDDGAEDDAEEEEEESDDEIDAGSNAAASTRLSPTGSDVTHEHESPGQLHDDSFDDRASSDAAGGDDGVGGDGPAYL